MNTELFKKFKRANDGSFTADLDVEYMNQNYPWFYEFMLREIKTDFESFPTRNDLELLHNKISVEFTRGTLLVYYYERIIGCPPEKVEIVMGNKDDFDTFPDKNESFQKFYFFLLEQAGQSI